MGETPQQRILREALEAIGSEAGLAAILEVTIAELRGWLAGEADIPAAVFFTSLDLLAKGYSRTPMPQLQFPES